LLNSSLKEKVMDLHFPSTSLNTWLVIGVTIVAIVSYGLSAQYFRHRRLALVIPVLAILCGLGWRYGIERALDWAPLNIGFAVLLTALLMAIPLLAPKHLSYKRQRRPLCR
jgi:hypothetical protein